MIVPMKHLTLLAIAGDRDATLEQLRDLGVLHVTVSSGDTARVRDAQRACQEVDQAVFLITRAEKSAKHLDEAPKHLNVPGGIDEVLATGRECAELESERDALEREVHRYAPFGNFDPAAVKRLATEGVVVKLFRVPTKKLPLQVEVPVEIIGTNGVESFGVLVGDIPLPSACTPVELPARAPAETRALLDEARREIATQTAALAAAKPLVKQFEALRTERRDDTAFALAYENMAEYNGAIDTIEGFVPEDQLGTIQQAAAKNGWGLATRDPLPGDNVPVLLRPPKIFRPVTWLFNALGIAPAYDESDISVPFYIFFTIFFAMIVGDAGYGAIFLALTLFARWKIKSMPRQSFILLTVFCVATILWGAATATYFGIAHESLPAPLRHPLSEWLANSDNVMFLCFCIGLVHLLIARLWNACLLFPNKKFIAQIGWAGALVGIFLAICNITIGWFHQPAWTWPLIGVSALLIACFTIGKGELRTHGIDLGMLPINLFSAMGDIISYLRLFAIGMASVSLAENFNLMATGLDVPIYVKIPAMVFILALGHGLNLAMAALSVLVHAVRLNTLEFSNAKGISWAGFAYRPFKKSTQP